MSLCLYLRTSAKDSRAPSMIDAWSVRSTMIDSLRCTSELSTPWLTMKPVEKTRAFCLPTNRASFSSSSMWMSRVPFRKRDPAQPVPYLVMAARAASFTLGWLVSPR